MSEQELQEFILKMTNLRKERTSTQASARSVLFEEGVITTSGELTEQYR